MGACLIFFIVILITFVSCYYVDVCIKKEAKAQKNRYEWTKLGGILEDASDYLTSEVRQYVITGEAGYFYDYWNEVYKVKRRDMAVKKLKSYHLTKHEIYLLEKAKKNSDQLIKTERMAMKLKLQTQDMIVNHNEELQKYKRSVIKDRLPYEYQNFTKQQKEKMAIDLLYNGSYEKTKKSIMVPIHAFQNSINKRLNIEVSKTVSYRELALKVQITCLMISVLLIGILLILIQKFYVHPVRYYTNMILAQSKSDFSEGKIPEVLPRGVYEMQYLGEKFNELSSNLQRQLMLRIRAEDEMRQARDKANDASKAKGEFLAKMSHELRTPLNSIIGYLYLFEKSPMMKKQKEYCISMKIASESLLKLINQVLDFSKIESGQMEFEYQALNIKKLVGEIISVMKPSAFEKGLKLKMQMDKEIPENVLGDSLRLKQILINLIGNAIKFSQNGGIIIFIELMEKRKKYCRVFFGVKDSAIGISQERIDSIFEDFIQGDQTITRRFGGTGLGLPITKKIIEEFNHGKDTLHVRSEEGKGSYFYFELDFEYIKDQRRVDREYIKKLHHKYKFCGQKILLVDDNRLNLRVEKEILEKAGLYVDTVQNGQEALFMIKETKYDLILLDVRMPDMNGYELAVKIRENKNYKKTPMVALTADIMGEVKEKIKEADIDYYLAKPLRPEKLLHVLNHELEESTQDWSVFDGNALLEMIDYDKEAYKELITMFINDQEKNFSDIKISLINSDYENLEDLLHKVKGVAGSLYCNLLYHTANELYQKAKEGQRIKLDVLWNVWNDTKQKMLDEI